MAASAVIPRWLGAPLFRWSSVILAAVVAGVFVFEALGVPVMRRIGMPHEYCYLREPTLVWLHVITDLLIGLAYVSISATLAYLVYRASKAIPFNWVFLAFGLFIVSCGLTHFMEVWVVWEPVYWLSGYVKVVTAAASVATAIALFPLLPKVFQFLKLARKSEQRRIEIRRLNEELKQFNYSVAHDLRGPIRSIKGYVETALEECGGTLSPECTAYLARVLTSADRMDRLIADLLRYANAGQGPLRLQAVALADLLKDVIASVDADIRATSAEIVVAPDLPAVVGDPTLLRAVFQNLLENALKFRRPGVPPRVAVSATSEGERAWVDVTDNGVGIPAESRGRIFGLFERVHGGGHQGSGIGLAIVARALDRMGGQIEVDAAPNGEGTRFRLALPLRTRDD